MPLDDLTQEERKYWTDRYENNALIRNLNRATVASLKSKEQKRNKLIADGKMCDEYKPSPGVDHHGICQKCGHHYTMTMKKMAADDWSGCTGICRTTTKTVFVACCHCDYCEKQRLSSFVLIDPSGVRMGYMYCMEEQCPSRVGDNPVPHQFQHGRNCVWCTGEHTTYQRNIKMSLCNCKPCVKLRGGVVKDLTGYKTRRKWEKDTS